MAGFTSQHNLGRHGRHGKRRLEQSREPLFSPRCSLAQVEKSLGCKARSGARKQKGDPALCHRVIVSESRIALSTSHPCHCTQTLANPGPHSGRAHPIGENKTLLAESAWPIQTQVLIKASPERRFHERGLEARRDKSGHAYSALLEETDTQPRPRTTRRILETAPIYVTVVFGRPRAGRSRDGP